MDSFEVNKIIAAVLLVALLVIGIGKIADIVFYIEKPETSGYKVELPESSTNQISQTKNQEEEVDISALLAMGTVAHGETVFKNVALVIQFKKVGKIKLAQHYTTYLEELPQQLLIINIQNL